MRDEKLARNDSDGGRASAKFGIPSVESDGGFRSRWRFSNGGGS